MLEQDDKLLLVQEAAPDIYGKWNQPAGHLDPGETLLACAVREAREESGYVVELTALQAIYNETTAERQRINFCFRASPCGEADSVDPAEILSTRWFSRDELQRLPDDQLRHHIARQRMADWLTGKCAPLELIAPWTEWV
jgi:8-oxo-dGTP pyrophosphatase MutT (NUDIX family)